MSRVSWRPQHRAFPACGRTTLWSSWPNRCCDQADQRSIPAWPPPQSTIASAGASCGARPPRRSAGSMWSMPPACPSPARTCRRSSRSRHGARSATVAAVAAQSWGACSASTTTGCRRAATTCSRPIRPSPISRCVSSVARQHWPAWSSLCHRPGGSFPAKPSAPGASSPGSTSMSTIRTSRNASSRAVPSRPWPPAGS